MDLICIDDHFDQRSIAAIPNRPVKDKMYTFRDMRKLITGDIGILVHELINPELPHGPNHTFEPGSHIRRWATINGDLVTKEMVKEFMDQKKSIEIGIEEY